MTSEKIIYTFNDPSYIGGLNRVDGAKKKIASMATILEVTKGTKAVALISYFGYHFPCLIVVGADNEMRRTMKHANLSPIQETEVYEGHTAMLVPLNKNYFGDSPMIDTHKCKRPPLTGFVLNQIGPVRARARYPTNSIAPKESKINGAMTCEQREALARAAGFQVPFGC